MEVRRIVLREPHLGLRNMLEHTKTLAILGAGLNEQKPAHRLFHDLNGRGWTLIPVHPNDKGNILSNNIVSTIEPTSVSVVVFFLSPQQTMAQLRSFEARLLNKPFPFIWLQPGAADDFVLEWLNLNDVPHVVDDCVVEFIRRHHLYSSVK
ncbi:MAG: CoA-binding protein [archaeon]|jgi:predicted CoA-binding protein|nr:CoA-binding protein [archaeon]MDA1167357.1 CoA-binding protein [archaeon]